MIIDPYLKEMGARIQAYRKAKKITIRGLGELCKLDYSTLCRIEGGQYASKITTLKNIAEKLEVDIKDIV
ncbi:MAG: helix-turn-helix domain-containing protein [Mucilaginibacter sp.]